MSSYQNTSVPSGSPPPYSERPLPPGWMKELDPTTNRHFYVDTMTVPTRSSWMHPLDMTRSTPEIPTEKDHYYTDFDDKSDANDIRPFSNASGSSRALPNDSGDRRYGPPPLPPPTAPRAPYQVNQPPPMMMDSSYGSDYRGHRPPSPSRDRGRRRGIIGTLRDAVAERVERAFDSPGTSSRGPQDFNATGYPGQRGIEPQRTEYDQEAVTRISREPPAVIYPNDPYAARGVYMNAYPAPQPAPVDGYYRGPPVAPQSVYYGYNQMPVRDAYRGENYGRSSRRRDRRHKHRRHRSKSSSSSSSD